MTRGTILQRLSGWGRAGGVILIATVVALLCLLYLWQGARIRELTAQVEGIREESVAIGEVNRWLEFQIGKAFSLERVARIARDRLGMVEPTDIHYVKLRIEG
ncbi:MAG: hypothetical protein U9Q23_04450 [Candidatus Bipolaricaulota bacterium]|nr:hypothetical protein [Candidatus Bipolaricaulota bacterium]